MITLFIFTFILGFSTSYHYGSAILKHDHRRSPCAMRVSLYIVFISSLLIMTASLTQRIDLLAYSLLPFVVCYFLLSLYLWYYGLSYKWAASEIKKRSFSIESMRAQLRKAL